MSDSNSNEKHLDVVIRYLNDMLSVIISDPISGDCTTKTFPYSPDEHPELDSAIGNELYWHINEMVQQESELHF